MSKYKDLSNSRFGKLLAVEMIRRPELARPIFWRCLCDCGNETICGTQDLIQGKRISCGCLKFDDLIGKRYGKLLVIKRNKIPGKGSMHWECQCDCGNISTFAANALKYEKTKSCGCKSNQDQILKFKKQNPNATYEKCVEVRLKAHSKWVGECLEWTATTSNGYGVFVFKNKTLNASRAAWICENGPIPEGMCVCHNCPSGDNRKCINVKHMFLGTHQENTDDMIAKGRDNYGGKKKES